MCYSTSLDRDQKALENALHRKLIDESKRVDLPLQLELPLGRTSAFARPAWPVVTSRDPGRISVLRWGLLPRFIRTDAEAMEFLKKAPTFNAISEEAPAKRTFRHAFEHGQRCLIPVTGFYEWRHEGKRRIPYMITLKDEAVFCLGGLWEQGALMDSYTVLTTRANPLMEHIHNTKHRQPVIIPRERWDRWLNPGLAAAEVMELCAPIQAERMVAEAQEKPAQGSLF